jgi:hypothetical protein
VDENLLGYLLDALDPQAHREVEAQLAARPELRERLESLRRTLEPLAADNAVPEPPPGLAMRALARLAEYNCRTLSQALPAAPVAPSLRRRRGLPRADLLVAACLLVVIAPLAVVGVNRLWRDYASRSTCANNLRLVGNALQRYADTHDGQFPRVEEDGPRGIAGVFMPVLRASGTLAPDTSLVCPGDGSRAQPARLSLQELDELFLKDPQEFAAVARDLAGSYAYSVGYREGGVLHGLGRDSGDGLPILADCPPAVVAGNSPNHGGAGQNVLYVGGQVRWCTQRTAGVAGDDIYLNRRAEVGAGVCRDDTVLGPGDASPHR